MPEEILEKGAGINPSVLVMVENPLNPMHLPRSSREAPISGAEAYIVRRIGRLINNTDELEYV